MGKIIKFLVIGIYFGIVLVKGQVISWFRNQEMFHFQSFHMFGVIGSAVFVGAISVLLIKLTKAKTFSGEEINLTGKPFNKAGNIIGGLLFGFGWALTGACPGPLYALLGAGYAGFLLAIIAALFGVYTYSILKSKLPH